MESTLNTMAGTDSSKDSTGPRKTRGWRLGVLSATAVLFLACALYWNELSTVQRDYFHQRRGELHETSVRSEQKHDRIEQWVSLASSSGLSVDLRLIRPLSQIGAGTPVILIVGGHRTGKDAVELVGSLKGIAYAAIDYPYAGSLHIRGVAQSMRAIPSVQQAFLDTPPALMLVRDWLSRQDWVDPSRIELVGVSLGVPFAATAGALDSKFARVWLIHGGADNRSWIEFALRRHISQDWMRRRVASLAHLLVYGNSFDTARWIAETAPRSVVIVAARDDERVPDAAVVAVQALPTGEHVELVWTDGRHIAPGRADILQQLLRIVASEPSGRDSPP